MLYAVLTPRLRATLLRISQGLEEQRLKQSTSNGTQASLSNVGVASGANNASGMSHMASESTPASTVFGGAMVVMTPSNFYALKVIIQAKTSLSTTVESFWKVLRYICGDFVANICKLCYSSDL